MRIRLWQAVHGKVARGSHGRSDKKPDSRSHCRSSSKRSRFRLDGCRVSSRISQHNNPQPVQIYNESKNFWDFHDAERHACDHEDTCSFDVTHTSTSSIFIRSNSRRHNTKQTFEIHRISFSEPLNCIQLYMVWRNIPVACLSVKRNRRKNELMVIIRCTIKNKLWKLNIKTLSGFGRTL